MGTSAGVGRIASDRQTKAAAALLAVLGFIVLSVQAIIGGSTSDLAYLGIGIILVGVTGRILSNWRDGFLTFFVWLLFEDLIRKYLGNNMLIYFAKDFLVGITYLSFMIALRRGTVKTLRPPFALTLGLFFGLGIIQVFNTNSPSIFFGLLGLKLYFYYAPLMFITYAIMNTEEDLRRFLVFNMGLAGIIALLGIIQSIVGLDFLNPATLAPELQLLGRLTRVSPLTGVLVARPTSVFVSDGRFAAYMVLMFIMGMGTAGYLLLRSHRGRLVVFPSIALCAVGAVMSGSRGAFVFVAASSIVVSAGVLWGAPWRWRAGHRLVRAIRRSVVLIALGLILLVVVFPAAIGARWTFYEETMSPDSAAFELGTRVWDYPFGNLQTAFTRPNWVWGNGIGTASLGLQYISGRLGINAPPIGVESGYGVLLVELGLLGLGLWIVWTSHLMIAAWRVARKVKETAFFPIAFAVVWFSFILLFVNTFASIVAYQNYTSNAYLWLLLGILFRLPDLAARSAGISAPAKPGRVA
jgi:hypothetical protein